MANEAVAPGAAVGKLDGAGFKHLCMADDGFWFPICGCGPARDVLADYLCDTPATCPGCKKVLKKLNALMVE